jgi:hypothetical protein
LRPDISCVNHWTHRSRHVRLNRRFALATQIRHKDVLAYEHASSEELFDSFVGE